MRKSGLSIALVALLGVVAFSPSVTAAPLAVQADVAGAAIVLPAPKAGRARPLVVVIADAGGAETTDFLIPYGVLKDSGVADVVGLSTAMGRFS